MSFNLSQLVSIPSRTVTTSPQTLQVSDGVLNSAQAGALALTLPALATVRGRTFYVRNQNNAAAITMTPAGGETIQGGPVYTMAVGVTFTRPCAVLYAPLTGLDWFVLGQTPL